jgi:hypothetical protein
MAENSYNNKNRNSKTLSKKNPNNEESPLYIGLTRLFSGPLASFRAQAQIRYKRRDLDRYKFTSASGQAFKKKSYNPFEAIQSNIMANQSRAERYSDFDQMEFMPELASALDVYADEMTTSNQFRNIITVESKNEEIKSILNNLYFNVLNLESNIFSWCRTMCKFGDFFLYLDIDEKLGIKSVLGLPSPEVERLEGEDESNSNYVQFQWNTAGLTFENWQVAHFRVGGQDKYSPYGTSILEPARRIWRQLQLMEDAMMAYRIVRAPERRVFYIDIGNVAPTEVEQFMQKIITQLKRNQIVDPNTGRVDLRYNPMSVDEDYYIPVRGQQGGTKIESLPGGQIQGAIDDVQYLRDKLFSAIRVPQAYLTSAKDKASEDKSTLAQKDIRFARTIQRLQRVIISELEKIGIIHLYTLGYRNEDLLKFKIKLNNPSKITELQEIEHFKAQLEVAGSAKEVGFSKRWVFENIFKMNDKEFVRIQRDIFYDKQFDKAVEAGETTSDAAAAGGTATVGTSEPAPTPDEAAAAIETPPTGGETPPTGETAGETPTGGEESSLLAAPARRTDGGEEMIFKRPDGSYKTPGSNNKYYTPEKYDGRSSSGPRSKNIKSTHTPESTSGATKRSILPGMSNLNLASKGIFNEEIDDSYVEDEKMLLEIDNKLKMLSKALFKEDKKSEKE